MTSLQSLLELEPKCNVTIYYSDLDHSNVSYLSKGFPTVNFIKFDQNLIGLKDTNTSYNVHKTISNKMLMWHSFYKNLNIDDRALFFDVDLLFYKSFMHELQNKYDLLFTIKKSEKYILNTGILSVTKNEQSEIFFTRWLEKIQEISDDLDEIDKAVNYAGAIDQAAALYLLNEIVGKINLGTNTYNLSNKRITISFKACSVLNETNSRSLNNPALIIHFKSGWRGILLENGPYSNARSLENSYEMHNLWENYYRKSLRYTMSNYVKKVLDDNKIEKDLENITYLKRGIFNSELLLIVSTIIDLKIDIVIDSGLAYGHSLKVLNILLPKYVKIYSVELEENEVTLQTNNSFKNVDRVEIIFGDAEKVIPKIIKKYEKKSVGLILDGPKGKIAVLLAKNLLRVNKNLKVLFFHDMRKLDWGKPSESRFILEHNFEKTYFTDEDWYVERTMYLDKKYFEEQKEISIEDWQPFHKCRQFVGSYGPTIGMVFPTYRDGFNAFEKSTSTRTLFKRKVLTIKKLIRNI